MRRLRVALACVAIVSIAACSLGTVLEPTKDPSQFFVLTPMDAPAHGAPVTYNAGAASKPLEVGLGPVKFPAYLARLEIVTRSSPNNVALTCLDNLY